MRLLKIMQELQISYYDPFKNTCLKYDEQQIWRKRYASKHRYFAGKEGCVFFQCLMKKGSVKSGNCRIEGREAGWNRY